ncbi:3'-5' exonuclease [Myxococcota bacterium]|nr:3'-5' exonuclease [Myxococcota bacterium]
MIGALRRRRARARLEASGADRRLVDYLSCSFSPAPRTRLRDVRFVVLDTETTGVDHEHDRLLSLAALGVRDGAVHVADRIELVFDGVTVGGERAARVHGLVTRDLLGGISEPEGVLRFLEFVRDDVVVAHHAGFDVGVLSQALGRLGAPPLQNAVIDTGVLATRLTRGPRLGEPIEREHRSLDALAAELGVEIPNRHTAGGDALATAWIFLSLLKRAARRGIETVGDLLG